jgi:hypothetical protein
LRKHVRTKGHLTHNVARLGFHPILFLCALDQYAYACFSEMIKLHLDSNTWSTGLRFG